MKPEQFIKRYGINEAKKIIDKAPNGTTHIHSVTLQNYMQGEGNNYVWCGSGRDGWYFSIYDTLNGMMALEDLKRLVESLDLVVFLGGIDGLNVLLDMANSPFALSGVTRDGVFYSSEKIKEIVAVHESIYGGGE
ncbi:hypothetical protein [Acinetobacter baumannii]|uniref:hypothetical protein n=1 Tax=Acinetobacter baumannii TaxID=470 RepID=UPI001FF1D04A|nr:hypothetical protein [Acinetobacter baumannii]MCJ9560695.1 hypothetical protein [Acinetobacter baumannii]